MKLCCLLVFILLLVSPFLAHAQEMQSTEVRTEVTSIEREYEVDGVPQAEFIAKDEAGQEYHVDTAQSYQEGLRYDLQEGDNVILQVIIDEEGEEQAFLVDIVRTPSLIWIAVILAVLTLAVGWWRGLSALVGLAVTLLIIFAFVLPRILYGANPVLTAAFASAGILGINMHLSHGFSVRTFSAFGSTLIGLGLAVLFSKWFVGLVHLSGLASEESVFLYWQETSTVSPVGILLAGIILGATGVLDDIAITQSETVAELKEANPELQTKELFSRAMRVGRHHIASTVNTLVLAYTGVALPLFLLYLNEPSVSMFTFLNTEQVAEEIVRTVAGTCALVLTVPIATYMAAVTAGKSVHKRA